MPPGSQFVIFHRFSVFLIGSLDFKHALFKKGEFDFLEELM
jgi:hypothetical protein